MTHKLKIYQAYADAILVGIKSFEIRYDDRGYQKGDLVEFNVIDNNDREINHPLNDKKFEIAYVIHGWGLKENWCVFSIREFEGGAEMQKGEEGEQKAEEEQVQQDLSGEP